MQAMCKIIIMRKVVYSVCQKKNSINLLTNRGIVHKIVEKLWMIRY